MSKDGKFLTKYRLEWQVPYQPGALKALGYSGGSKVAEQEIRTAGASAGIKLSADRTTIDADGDDLSYVTVRIEDKDGNLCPVADNLVRFRVTGAGDIAGVDNGNAATTEPFHADYRHAFNGLALVIVRSRPGPGKIHVEARSERLAPAAFDIDAVSSTRVAR